MSRIPNANSNRPLRVLLSAGEASGEMYGAELIAALRELHGRDLECFGLGGERMREAGCELVVEAREVAVVGLFEVLSHLPHIYRQFHRLLAEADRRRPDVAVLIDFPDWNFRLAKQLHRRGIPVVYYVSPQLWAWRTGRIKLVQRYVSRMLVIFPFERDFYAQHGVQAEFVGHPLSELEPPHIAREEFARRWKLDPSRQWIALLPGSRRKELRMNLPTMLAAAARLGPGFEYVLPVASTLEGSWVEEQVAQLQRSDGQMNVTTGQSEDSDLPIHLRLTDDARASLLHARVGVVASGTATVEAALIGTPFVMVYRLGRLTWMLGRRLVRLPFYGMVNLIAGREVVPELIQERFTPEAVECHVRMMLEDGAARQRTLDGLAEVRDRLRGAPAEGVIPSAPAIGALRQSERPAQRAARAVLSIAAQSSASP